MESFDIKKFISEARRETWKHVCIWGCINLNVPSSSLTYTKKMSSLNTRNRQRTSSLNQPVGTMKYKKYRT